MKNPFKSYPKRGRLRLLCYGDPGTQKTRRALRMPGPIYIIDLEDGAGDYADLVADKEAHYVSCRGYQEVLNAVLFLKTLPADKVGTVVIDRVGGVYLALQHMRREAVRRGRNNRGNDPAATDLQRGDWGTIKIMWEDFLAHVGSIRGAVVLLARRKEGTDNNGRPFYTYESEKGTDHWANVLIESRRDRDHILKDRTGTFTEGQARPRVEFTEFLNLAGTANRKHTTASRAASRDAGHHATWTSDARTNFCTKLGAIGYDYDQVADYLEAQPEHAPWSGRPSTWHSDERRSFYHQLEAGRLPEVPKKRDAA